MESLINGLERLLHLNLPYHDNSNNSNNSKYDNNNNNEICGRPKYRPNYWNNLDKNTRDNTNCYSYAFDRYEVNADKKLQPGELSNSIFNAM